MSLRAHDDMAARAITRDGLAFSARRLRDPVLYVVVPLLLSVAFVAGLNDILDGQLAFDFRGTLWQPAKAVLESRPVYPEPTAAAMLVGNPAVYPPLFFVLLTPLAVLPVGAASVIWMAVLLASIATALWVLGVRDWRCFALALSSPAVLQGVTFGNLTVFLVLVLALVWRCRRRALRSGLLLGVAIASKVLLLPVAVWLVLTRRFLAAIVAMGSALVLVAAPWAVIRWDGIREYPQLIAAANDAFAAHSFSLVTVASGLGLGSVGLALAVVTGLVLVGLAALLARRGGGEAATFAVVVAASLVAAPILWPSYLALMLVPLAVAQRRLGLLWIAFVGLQWLSFLVPPAAARPGRCCPPGGVPTSVWEFNTGPPSTWRALALIVAILVLMSIVVVGHGWGRTRSSPASRMDQPTTDGTT